MNKVLVDDVVSKEAYEYLKKELEDFKSKQEQMLILGISAVEDDAFHNGVFEGSRREKERTKEVIDKTYEERLILSDYECTIVLNYLRKELGLGEEDEEDDEVERT